MTTEQPSKFFYFPLQVWRHFLGVHRFTAWKDWLSDKEKILAQISRPEEKRDWKNNPELIFHVSIAESGRPKLVFPNFEAEIDVSLEFVPPTQGLFNFVWKTKIINEESIPNHLLEDVKDLAIAAVSFQSRLITGCSTAFFQDSTLDIFAKELYYYQFPSDKEQQEYEKQFPTNP